MIKNCLMNFMLVLPVFSSDCRGRAGSQGARGTELVRVPGSFGLPKPPGLLGLPRPRGFPDCTKRLGCVGFPGCTKRLGCAGFPGCTNRLGCVGFPGRTNWCYQSLYTCVRFCQDEVAEFCRNRKKTRSRLEKIESCADEFTRKTGICSLVISDCRWRTVLLPP